jgi:hypothetical protein
MSFHKGLAGSDVHVVHAFTYADASARAGATGLTAADEGKVALQSDTRTYWVLQNYSPVTWSELSSESSGITGPVSSTDNALVRFDGTAGNLVQNSGAVLDDIGNLTLPGTLNGIHTYAPAAVDPSGSPTLADGYLYYNTSLKLWMFYDGSRSKWLSIEKVKYQFGRDGSTAVGSYFYGTSVLAMSSTRGFTAPRNGTVVGLGYTRSDSDAATFEVVNNGSSLATLASSAVKGKSTALNANFAADEVLAVRNQSAGNTVSDVTGWFEVRWRV